MVLIVALLCLSAFEQLQQLRLRKDWNSSFPGFLQFAGGPVWIGCDQVRDCFRKVIRADVAGV
jgi:hypothetical protein